MKKSKYKTKSKGKSKIKSKLPETRILMEPDENIYAKNSNSQDRKVYDLEERTFVFAKRIRSFVKLLPVSITNNEDIKQLARSSASVGANYIEANESLGKKDFLFKLRISRREAKESRFFLRLLDADSKTKLEDERALLIKESTELICIFGAIIKKSL
jgi:four helix bundle protein